MTTVGFKQIMFMLLRERSGCLADSRPGLGGGGGPSEWLLGAGFAEGRNCSGPAGFTLYSYSVIVTLLGNSKYVALLVTWRPARLLK